MPDTFWRWGEYFKPIEVLSPVGMQQYEENNNLLISPHYLDFLLMFRNWLGVRLYLNGTSPHTGNILRFRGYRSPEENHNSGGSSLSRHIQGIAGDMSTREEDMSTRVLYEKALEFGFGGVGLYHSAKFVHGDIRPKIHGAPTRWIKP
jgi:hypothetical protein